MTSENGNLLAALPRDLADEQTTELLASENLKIERIVSTGQASPPGFLYDQDWAEWVLLIAGSAGLLFEGEAESRILRAGDFLLIPAHRAIGSPGPTPSAPRSGLPSTIGRGGRPRKPIAIAPQVSYILPYIAGIRYGKMRKGKQAIRRRRALPAAGRDILPTSGAPGFMEDTPLAAGLLGPGGVLAVDRVADAFGMSKFQLAETVGLKRETFYKSSRARAPKTQARMREMLEIISRIATWAGGKDQAMAWYRAQPIPAFGGRTAEALVKSGNASAVRDYLDHIAMGGFA